MGLYWAVCRDNGCVCISVLAHSGTVFLLQISPIYCIVSHLIEQLKVYKVVSFLMKWKIHSQAASKPQFAASPKQPPPYTWMSGPQHQLFCSAELFLSGCAAHQHIQRHLIQINPMFQTCPLKIQSMMEILWRSMKENCTPWNRGCTHTVQVTAE